MKSQITTGSSETIRKTAFNFSNYREKLVSHKKSINLRFLEWFVGFSEGDGSFIVSKTRIFFIINQKEEKVLHRIRTELGFGKVSTYNTYSRFIVADRDNIERLIHLFNGNLVFYKTNSRFELWLESWNLSSKEERRVTPLPQNQLLSFENNGWLSGFTDADGCFNAVQTKDSRYSLGWRLRLRFILDQKSEKNLLEKVRNLFQSGVISRRREVDDMWRFTCTSIISHRLVIDYFTRYPLRTVKKVSFLRFVSLFRYITTRPVLPWEGKVLKRIDNLIKKIS